MAALITTIGSVVTGVLGWMGDTLGVIFQQTTPGTYDYPILILSLVIGFVGVGIGYMKRIMN